MDMPGVAEAATMLRDFHFEDPTWDGKAFLPCWDCELDVSIDPDEEGITARQLAILQSILGYPRDLRPEFEQALFVYYQAEVDGTYCSYDTHGRPIPGSGPPILTAPSQVWKLIDQPVMCIPWIFHTEAAVEFSLTFNCEWDPEHGLGVRYRDWQPVEFGGWDL